MRSLKICDNLGTENALCKLTEYVNNCFNEGKKTLGVFLDLSKAFDTVSHRILLERLENIGIRGVSLQLFKTYLSNRSQQVRLRIFIVGLLLQSSVCHRELSLDLYCLVFI